MTSSPITAADGSGTNRHAVETPNPQDAPLTALADALRLLRTGNRPSIEQMERWTALVDQGATGTRTDWARPSVRDHYIRLDDLATHHRGFVTSILGDAKLSPTTALALLRAEHARHKAAVEQVWNEFAPSQGGAR